MKLFSRTSYQASGHPQGDQSDPRGRRAAPWRAPRIHAGLRDRGHGISRWMIAGLMGENGIRPPRGKRRAPITTDSRRAHAISPNLLDRSLELLVPGTVRLADISRIPADEGWLRPRGREGPRHQGDRRRVDVRAPEGRLARGGAQEGDPEPPTHEGPDPSFRSRCPARPWRLSCPARAPWHRSLDGPQGEPPRQRAHGELPRLAENRACPPDPVRRPRRGERGALRAWRDLP
jgi:hypothetical protein